MNSLINLSGSDVELWVSMFKSLTATFLPLKIAVFTKPKPPFPMSSSWKAIALDWIIPLLLLFMREEEGEERIEKDMGFFLLSNGVVIGAQV